MAWLLRAAWVMDGFCGFDRPLTWEGGSANGVTFDYDLTCPDEASLKVTYRQKRNDGNWVDHTQHIWLDYTVTPFGGQRWWMQCPVSGNRVGKLYLPPGGDIFASRKVWRLGYRSQRCTDYDRALKRMFALQRKLGCKEGCQHRIHRPKGMWQRTFVRHQERYRELDAEICAETLRRFPGNCKL